MSTEPLLTVESVEPPKRRTAVESKRLWELYDQASRFSNDLQDERFGVGVPGRDALDATMTKQARKLLDEFCLLLRDRIENGGAQ